MPILLKQLIQDYKSLMLGSTPPELIDRVVHEQTSRRQSVWFKSVLRAGHQAPDINLPVSGEPNSEWVPLSRLLQHGPVLLKFYRGRWCPFCTLELKAYEKLLPRLREAGVQLIVITSEADDCPATGRDADATGYSVVRDPTLEIARTFGLTYAPGPAEAEICRRLGYSTPAGMPGEPQALALPALYLIGTDGSIVYANVPSDPSLRDEPTHVLQLAQESCGLV